MSDPKPNDPEVNSEFAKSKRLAREKGVHPGVDPVSGEIGGLTFRLLYNLMNGDAKRAEAKFREVARLGGFGDVGIYQTLDLKSIEGAREQKKELLESGFDEQGLPMDLFGRRAIEQQIQFHDNVLNEVREALQEVEKG